MFRAQEVEMETQTTPDLSLLMDKLPAELRLKVFGMVLRAEHGLMTLENSRSKKPKYVPPHRAARPPLSPTHPHRLNVALLTVNRQISREAEEALFTVNTVVTRRYPTPPDYLYQHHDQIRRMKFGSYLCDQLFHAGGYDIVAALRHMCAAHPKLQSVNIATELLAEELTTVREFVGRHTDLCALRFIDIGLYDAQLAGEATCKVIFEDLEIIELLPPSKKLLAQGLVGVQEKWRKASGLCFGDRKSRETLLAFFLGCYEIYREEDYNPDAFARRSTAEKTIVEQHGDRLLYQFPATTPFKSMLLPDDVELVNVNAGEHPPELVEWASNFIGFGIRNLDITTDFNSTDSDSDAEYTDDEELYGVDGLGDSDWSEYDSDDVDGYDSS